MPFKAIADSMSKLRVDESSPAKVLDFLDDPEECSCGFDGEVVVVRCGRSEKAIVSSTPQDGCCERRSSTEKEPRGTGRAEELQ